MVKYWQVFNFGNIKVVVVFALLGILVGAAFYRNGYQNGDDVSSWIGTFIMIFIPLLAALLYITHRKVSKYAGFGDINPLDIAAMGIAEVLSMEETGEDKNNAREFNLLLKITYPQYPDQEPLEVEHKQAFRNYKAVFVGANIPVFVDTNKNVHLDVDNPMVDYENGQMKMPKF